ncbi:hypothetical protein, partial [Acetobacter cerevisiae]|uniref:hypothetical protein n=2 Tax=Acetobacter cerevisiae TaxID=178900 RepID=UPI002231C271
TSPWEASCYAETLIREFPKGLLGGSIGLKYVESLKNTLPFFTDITPGTIFLNVGDGTKLTRIDHSSVSIFREDKYDTSWVRMGLVGDGDGTALGLAAYRTNKGEDGKTLNGSYISPSSVRVTDTNNKLRSIIGSVGLTTTNIGSTEITAPSTIVLFDKDGKVLYRLPAY